MTITESLAGSTVEVDAEGFLTDPSQWNEEIAAAIARENGIPELTPRHLQVAVFMRRTYLDTGQAPSIRTLAMSYPCDVGPRSWRAVSRWRPAWSALPCVIRTCAQL